MTDIYWGDALIRPPVDGGAGELVLRDGEEFYKITHYQGMPPFFMTVVSGSNHWMFVSSTGGLTCGRESPENALFPYTTDDKIHDAWSTTGPQTVILVATAVKTCLWKPFGQDVNVYRVERNLYKNRVGNKLIFEEINHDLGLVFSYGWSSSDRFGFVKTSKLHNIGKADLQVNILDGLRNLLPYGVTKALQTEMSTLLDAYKQAEAFHHQAAAVYTMSSTLTDRAEPSEALKATVVWSTGLENPQLLLSEDQVEAFCTGAAVTPESISKGKRGAFFVRAAFAISPSEQKSWRVMAGINHGPCEISALLDSIDRGTAAQAVEQDIEAGTRRLMQLVGAADGCQLSSDALATGRHFSNILFNIMRGGAFYAEYRFPLGDLLDFVRAWNKPLEKKFKRLLRPAGRTHTLASVLAAAQDSADADMLRLALEYLPLTFSRRHGDPSRPWNQFSIDIMNTDGSDKLYYQGNWRDIFQNWEALAVSYPGFTESFISKFVNASTADGYNPYRITKDGFEWEVLDHESPWSNIGYWGDHQVNYLVKLIELSCRYHPGKITAYLGQEIFVYADLPYRLKDYQSLLDDPRNSVFYDDIQAAAIARRVNKTGSDGKLYTLSNGSIYHVNLLEKLLVPALSKLGNFVPGGGIWMNTQRPEWNDANNALVGYGLSMVTACYLRRYLVALRAVLERDALTMYSLSIEVISLFSAIEGVLKKFVFLQKSPIKAGDRKAFMDAMGLPGEEYRERVYAGLSGNKSGLDKPRILAFIDLAKTYLDHSIGGNQREDGLFHSYNLIQINADGCEVENLYEMLEGQVAVLSSGYLDERQCLDLLTALRSSKMYRQDQNSYLLYPDRNLPLFRKKNVIDPSLIRANRWLQAELASGRRGFVEQDVNGDVHFNGNFRNAKELRAALDKVEDRETGISAEDKSALCDVYESVFNHRRFTGRSGAMYKYEGLGCIYWHMVSKLLLATAETIRSASENGIDQEHLTPLLERYDDIKEGLGLHKSPALYGAFPVDPYSHTTGFSGVQQPGMTGQVKEDVITRFYELGVNISDGEVSFSPVLLKRNEFIPEPRKWHFCVGGAMQSEDLDAGSMAFSLCGVPVIYRLAEHSGIQVYTDQEDPLLIQGNRLGRDRSQSLFQREKRIRKLVVNLPARQLRP